MRAQDFDLLLINSQARIKSSVKFKSRLYLGIVKKYNKNNTKMTVMVNNGKQTVIKRVSEVGLLMTCIEKSMNTTSYEEVDRLFEKFFFCKLSLTTRGFFI